MILQMLVFPLKMITTGTLCSDMYVNLYLWFLRHTKMSV